MKTMLKKKNIFHLYVNLLKKPYFVIFPKLCDINKSKEKLLRSFWLFHFFNIFIFIVIWTNKLLKAVI